MSKIIFSLCVIAIIGAVLSTTCKDGSTCYVTSTCCLTPSGAVGCCPYENATCCSDGLHCCPQGYTCDLARGQCVMGNNSFLAFVSMSESTPAKLTASTPSLKSFPSIKDLIKCAEDIKPVATDIYNAYEEYKKGTEEGKENAKKLLVKILEESVVMGTDCYKVISEIIN
jgi:hypothetical protein